MGANRFFTKALRSALHKAVALRACVGWQRGRIRENLNPYPAGSLP
jgi:hypothetical protein